MIPARALKSTPGFSSAWYHVHRKVTTTWIKHGIPHLELCCFNLGILILLATAWNTIVLMHYSNNVTCCWPPASEIIRNKSWLLKSHMAHTQCVKFLKVCRWGIAPVDHSMTQETSILTRSSWRTTILMLCSLQVSTQSATSSGKLPVCNEYLLWQPDELHQLLQGLVTDLSHWLLKYQKVRQVKDKFDNRLPSVPWYPGLQHISKLMDSLNSGTW